MTRLTHESPEESIVAREVDDEVKHALAKALNRIAARNREIFVAHFVDGKTYEELSREHNLPITRIAGRISVAKSQLGNDPLLALLTGNEIFPKRS